MKNPKRTEYRRRLRLRLDRLAWEAQEAEEALASGRDRPPAVFLTARNTPKVEIDHVRPRVPVMARGTVDGTPFLLFDDGKSWSVACGENPDDRPDWEIHGEHASGSPVLDALGDRPGSSYLGIHWRNMAIRRIVAAAAVQARARQPQPEAGIGAGSSPAP